MHIKLYKYWPTRAMEQETCMFSWLNHDTGIHLPVSHLPVSSLHTWFKQLIQLHVQCSFTYLKYKNCTYQNKLLLMNKNGTYSTLHDQLHTQLKKKLFFTHQIRFRFCDEIINGKLHFKNIQAF